MYKSRFWLWVFVGLMYLAVFFGYPAAKTAIDSYMSIPKTATISSYDSNTRRAMDNGSISRTTLQSSTGNADVIINIGNNKTAGYTQESFYSPIVAVVKDTYGDELFEDIGGSNRYVRAMNLKEVMNGFLEDKKFSEFYSCISKGDLYSHSVNLAVDEKYEKEIKYVMLMAFSGHVDITKEDAEQHMKKVNEVWDKAVKLDNVESLLSNTKLLDDMIILTTENKAVSNASSLRALSLTNTVFVDFTSEYKDGFEYIVKSDSFMDLSGLRRLGVTKYTDGNLFSHSDWTIAGIHNKDINIELVEIKTTPSDTNISVPANDDLSKSYENIETNTKEENTENVEEKTDESEEINETVEENTEDVSETESDENDVNETQESVQENQESDESEDGVDIATIILIILFFVCVLFVVFLFIRG